MLLLRFEGEGAGKEKSSNMVDGVRGLPLRRPLRGASDGRFFLNIWMAM